MARKMGKSEKSKVSKKETTETSSKLAPKKSLPTKEKLSSKQSAPEPVKVEPVKSEPVPEDVSKDVEVDDSQSSVSDILASLLSTTQEITLRQKSLQQSLKAFARNYKKEFKELQRNASKSRKSNKKDPNRPKRAPSGFAVPSKISGEMCSFLGVAQDTQLSRTDVTRKLTTYIREKNLQVPANRRSFQPDAPLSAILGPLQEVDKDKGYTYFNLQRYITPHIMSSSAN